MSVRFLEKQMLRRSLLGEMHSERRQNWKTGRLIEYKSDSMRRVGGEGRGGWVEIP